MSNLSELLPAGAGAKEFEAVASGALSSGQTVILNSDGTVEAVASASTPAAKGSSVAFNSVDSNGMRITYSSANQKVIVTYRDQDNNSYGTVVVGTVSGTSISFGSPVVYNSANSVDGAPVSDENTGKIVIFYRDQGNAERGTAKVGTISGTSISFGSAVVFNSGGASNYNSPVYDPDTQKVVNFYKDEPNSNYATAIVGTVSGTSISFGSEVVWQSGEAEFISATYDTSANKMVVAYRDNSNSLYGTAIVGTVSGTSISFGAKSVYNTGDSRYNAIAYDASSGSVVVAYQDFSNSSYATAVVGTVSGTSISFGAEVVFSATNPTDHIDVVYFAAGQNVVVSYEVNDDSFYKVGTVSGSSITFDAQVSLVAAPAAQSIRDGVLAYDSNQSKIVFAYQQSSSAGKGIVFNPAYSTTNNTDFIGITAEAISDTATGVVTPKGGVITNSSLVDFLFSNGSSSVFESASTLDIDVVHDSANDKMVICYKDSGNSNYGTAIVGTVSGESITFGSPTVFASVNAQYSKIAYDSTNNKVVINYIDGTNSDHAKAIVGTVSGTSISFGSATTYNTVAGGAYTAIVYDSGNDKFVVKCAESSARYNVGTVSGTSISFGAQTTEGMQYNGSLVYDSVSGKVVSVYRDVGPNDYGKAIVGTVSGTSISFGSAATFDSTAVDYVSAVYDTDKQKVVVAYHDVTAGDYGKGVVGTVSGTSISFGTPSTFNAAGTDYVDTVYDSNINKPVIVYQDTGNSSYGTIVGATVSGTDITFSGEYVFLQGTANRLVAGYDSTNNKIITAYRDSDGSGYGTSIVISAADSLTTGLTYYVQDDGSLSTTSSSVTAGKAIANTTLLLKG
jgi:hypothetical protein